MHKILSSVLFSVAMLGVANAAPIDAGKCFLIPQFQNWKALDDHTMYIRVNMNHYYRIDMAGRCSSLAWPDAHLITHWRGTSSVCSALDWDLKVEQSQPGGIAEPCIVKTMTPLTATEAAAIPKKFKP